MSKTLLIVESPTKAKKIQKFLGSAYDVKASVGHIRDLPHKGMGIDFETVEMEWVVDPDKKKIVKNLRTSLKFCDDVILATDPDREGEAIAWHLAELLNIKNPKRVTFNEITKVAIEQALSNPTTIDLEMVHAQITRRALDRIVGFIVSPALNEAYGGAPVSAGRVQSVAVRLTDAKETKIKSHISEPYYDLEIPLNNVSAQLKLESVFGEKTKHLKNSDFASSIKDQVCSAMISSLIQDNKAAKPRPPFTTSTFQQACVNSLKISPEIAMKEVQTLFEHGLVTYHRTDTPNYSAEGFELLTNIASELGVNPREEMIKRTSGDSAQDAHEALRITGSSFDDEANESDKLTKSGTTRKVYDLIRERSISSVLKDGIDSVTEIRVTTNTIIFEEKTYEPIFHWKGKTIIESGWRSFCVIEKSQAKTEQLESQNFYGQTLNEGVIFDTVSSISKKMTKAEDRYTEASLIKALEKLGIGRPSTYADILKKIKHRKFIKIIKNQIHTQQLGSEVAANLKPMQFMDYGFTKQMELILDQISKGEIDYKPFILEFYSLLTSEMKGVKFNFSKQVRQTQDCPHCNEPLKFIDKPKKNETSYWLHTNRNHSCIVNSINDDNGLPSKFVPLRKHCPRCTEEIVLRENTKQGGLPYYVHVQDTVECATFIQVETDARTPITPIIKTCNFCKGLVSFHKPQKKEMTPYYMHLRKDAPCSRKFINEDNVSSIDEHAEA